MAKNVKRLFTHVYGEEKAVVIDKALDLIDRGMVAEGNEELFFNKVLACPAESYSEIEKEFHRPRKARTMSEEQKQKSYETQLAKLKEKYGIVEG